MVQPWCVLGWGTHFQPIGGTNIRQEGNSRMKLKLMIVVSALLGVSAGYGGCIWTWEQDNCTDVLCPSGCYQAGEGTTQSRCNEASQNEDICCTCWFRSRTCYYNGSSTRCYRASPPAPNPYLWQCHREEAYGPCEEGIYGQECLTSPGQDPWAV